MAYYCYDCDLYICDFELFKPVDTLKQPIYRYIFIYILNINVYRSTYTLFYYFWLPILLNTQLSTYDRQGGTRPCKNNLQDWCNHLPLPTPPPRWFRAYMGWPRL